MAKIICIDDDRDILAACGAVLKAQGHTVETAVNGKEGFEKASKQLPDLIVLDVMMDDATEGFHTAYKFRKTEALKFTPILMLGERDLPAEVQRQGRGIPAGGRLHGEAADPRRFRGQGKKAARPEAGAGQR